MSQVQICVNCQTENPIEEAYCTKCGYILPSAVTNSRLVTHNLDEQTVNIPLDIQWGTGYFHRNAKVFLWVEGTNTETSEAKVITLEFDPLREVDSRVLGRTLDSDESDHIDLSDVGAVELGVSRRHVRLERVHNSVHVTDLRSVNGTWLNRERLVPGVPKVLRNRSLLQLGKMVLRVQFA